MPLRDHFHAPLDDFTSWEGLHGGWPMVIVQSLTRLLPPRYVAAPRVHSGALVGVDVATYEHDAATESEASRSGNGSGSVATAVWAPSQPTLSVITDLPAQDEYEVRVFDTKRGRRLVAAVEIVSPANKDRPEHRSAFVAKCAALLQNQVSITIVDLVTARHFNLYSNLLELIGQTDPALGSEPPSLYAVASREMKVKEKWKFETWLHALQVGRPLPTLPLWLAENLFVPLDLESTYEETCKALRIP